MTSPFPLPISGQNFLFFLFAAKHSTIDVKLKILALVHENLDYFMGSVLSRQAPK
jgi:hypothetical protein